MAHQLYQPLSAALHAPLQSSHTSQSQHYSSYTPHVTPSTTTANGVPQHSQQREEEEEEEDDEEIVEEELEHRDQLSPGMASPRVAAVHPSKSAGTTLSAASTQYTAQVQPSTRDDDQNALDDSKRKPGRPRGSRNRKPRASTSTSSKAPAGSQHPGFYQYPPAPGGSVPNQHFYDFQWRALNLCSEFYNAAEELIKNAPPMVIAQCYHSGPANKIDPLGLIAEAKRVCDSLLANPSQLAGQPPPAAPAYTPYPPLPSYSTMPPPPAPGSTAPGTPAATATSMINNPQSFIMPLGAAPMPPAPGYPPQTYYTTAYPPAPGSRYPPTSYYYGPPQSSYYPPPPSSTQSTPAPPSISTPTSVPPPTPAGPPAAAVLAANTPVPQQSVSPTPVPPVTANAVVTTAIITTNTSAATASTSSVHPPQSPASGLSAFNATTGDAAPGGTQGAWSEVEIEKLRRLAEQSRTMGGPQNRGEIEWDWVVQQWGNSRTRHQILLKATSLGLKESTTRGTKRRREPDSSSLDNSTRQVPPPVHNTSTPTYSQLPAPVNVQAPSPAQSSASNPSSAQASPATQPMRPPSSSLSNSLNPTRPTATASSGGYAWPMPTIATSNSPILTPTQIHTQTQNQAPSQPETSPSTYYRRPQQPAYGATTQSPSTQTSALRPPSSHGMQSQPPNHHYMYRPLQNGSAMPRRENGM